MEKRIPKVPIFLKRLHDVSVKIGSRARFLVEIDSVQPLKVSDILCLCDVSAHCTFVIFTHYLPTFNIEDLKKNEGSERITACKFLQRMM